MTLLCGTELTTGVKSQSGFLGTMGRIEAKCCIHHQNEGADQDPDERKDQWNIQRTNLVLQRTMVMVNRHIAPRSKIDWQPFKVLFNLYN